MRRLSKEDTPFLILRIPRLRRDEVETGTGNRKSEERGERGQAKARAESKEKRKREGADMVAEHQK
jgi:hypothetical protein